jgi:hypothetical protein
MHTQKIKKRSISIPSHRDLVREIKVNGNVLENLLRSHLFSLLLHRRCCSTLLWYMDWMRTGFPRYCRNMHYPQCYFLELRRHDPVQESLVFHHIRWICFPILSDNTFRFHTKSKSLVSRCNVRNRTFLRSADLGMSEQHCYTAPAHFDFSVSDRQYAKMWTKYGPAHPRAC